MDEYIKREEALKIIDNYAKAVNADGKVVVDAIRDIIGIITPTADVVPKSEVLEIISEIDSMISLVSAMIGLDIIAFGKYAELKKKYTEDQRDE